MSIAVFRYGDPEREAAGVQLLRRASAMLRAGIEAPELGWTPPGPGFDFELSRDIFPATRGYGPLHVVWDTNLLIDYFEHGKVLWELGVVPEQAHWPEELEALQLVMALWVIRDIRFHVLPRVLIDARKRLSAERRAQRIRALEAFSAALALVDSESDAPIEREGVLILPATSMERTLAPIPHRLDRALIADAISLGAHVFLTKEPSLARKERHVRVFGLRIMTPGDLLEALCSFGAYHCLLAPEHYALWPLPDQARVSFLLDALADDQQPSSPTDGDAA